MTRAVKRVAVVLNDHQPHPTPEGYWSCLACAFTAPSWAEFADHLAPVALAAARVAEVRQVPSESSVCGHEECPFMVIRTDVGWYHVDTHGVDPGHPARPYSSPGEEPPTPG